VTLQVTGAAAPAEQKPNGVRTSPPRRADETFALLIGAIAIIGLLLFVPRIRRASALRRRVREIARPPAEIRAKLQALLAAHKLDEATLLREQSDRGDAYRSLHSRLDFDDSQEEVEFRLRELLQLLK